MKVSLSWLKEYIPLQMNAAGLSDALTMAGLEVDSVEDRYAYLDTVVVGRIDAVSPHPQSEKLKVCRVNTGSGERVVVCGAPNVEIGMLAPCALPGTEMPDGTVLEDRPVHGQRSEGMLCSEGELALGPDWSGVMALGADAAPGASLAEVLQLSDATLEIDLTPNRPDCLSIIGIAREVAAIQQSGRVGYPDIPAAEGDAVAEHTSVTILAPDACPRYAARLLTDIKVAPSPFWLQDRLLSVGLRPINNIVDVTNYIMLEMGQPLHAFDFDNLAGHRIVVRESSKGETFVTLDEREHQLEDGMLMICDAEKPVALAGVMGGLNSEINPDTTHVLIESAYFSPTSIRRTAKKLGLSTDASHRFERGVDPDGTVDALNRAARLMAEISGGRLVKGVVDVHPGTSEQRFLTLSVERANRLLGLRLTQDEMAKHLRSIEFSVEIVDADTLRVKAPAFRVDISRPEDLMEEVARRAGYDNIPTTFPSMQAGSRRSPGLTAQRERIKDIMTGFGFFEAVNYSFVGASAVDQMHLADADSRRSVVRILNPLTEEQAVMRTSLIPGLLEAMRRNNAHQNKTLKLFETGKIFLHTRDKALPDEQEMVAGLWTGLRSNTAWHIKETPCDFFDLKGVLEGLFSALGIVDAKFAPTNAVPYLKTGAAAEISASGSALGVLGEVAPSVLADFGLKQTAFIFELDTMALVGCMSRVKTADAIPRYPATSRDITLIIDKRVYASDIVAKIGEQKQPFVEDVLLFDVYEGQPIPSGKKSISIRLVYRSPEATLEDEHVNQIHSELSKVLLDAFDAALPA